MLDDERETDLVAADLADGEIGRLWMCKVQGTDRGTRPHCKRLSQFHPGAGLNVHQLPHGGLLSVVRLARIAGRWSNALHTTKECLRQQTLQELGNNIFKDFGN